MASNEDTPIDNPMKAADKNLKRKRELKRQQEENAFLAKALLFFLVLLGVTIVVTVLTRSCKVKAAEAPGLVSVEAAAHLPPPPTEDQLKEQALVQEVADGFLVAIRAEKWRWYGCGEVTPPEEEPARALELVNALRVGLIEVGLLDQSYLWAAAAIVYQESRGNPCALGPNSRKWAARHKIVNKHLIRWTAQDALKVMLSPKAKRRGVGFDAGIGQTIWPENAHVLDENDEPRVATAEEMTTVEGGARALAYHMFENSQIDKRRPWLYWPGRRDDVYGSKLAWIVRRMHGPSKNIGVIVKIRSGM